MSDTDLPHPRLDASTMLVVLAFTLASALGVNPYTYGTGDNSITIPFLKSWVDPSLYPGDYLLAQRQFYYTYLWNGLGWLHLHLGVALPALFFGAYLIALFFTFLGIHRIALALFGRREVAVIALLFLLFSKETLASVHTIEWKLNTRGVATPFLIFALLEYLRGRTVRSFALLGLAYLAHPLTANFMIGILFVAAAFDFRRGGLRRLAVGIPVFVVVASPLIVWRLRHTPPSFHPLSADPVWLVALHHRSAHHMFPSDWGWGALWHSLLMIGLFAIGWHYRNRDREERHRVIAIAAATVIALCIVGIVGSDLHPVGIVFLTQPPRSFQFMEYFAILYAAHLLYRALDSVGRIAGVVAAVVVAAFVLDGVDRVAIARAAFAAIVIFMAARRLARRPLGGAALLVTAVAIAGASAWAGYAMDREHLRPTFAITDDEETIWMEVEHWAAAHTDRRDAFIVPPQEEEEFRVHGERTVYADIEDGGLMNANPDFGKEWLRRMHMLGFEDTTRADFCRLDLTRLRRIADEMRATNPTVFVVWPCDDRPLPLEPRFRNEGYLVYEVPRDAGAAPLTPTPAGPRSR